MKFLCHIGTVDVFLHNHGLFKLDGGAMFGVVPRPIWETRIVPDSRGRIPMSALSIVLRDAQRCILVDTGCGNKWEEKLRERYAVEAENVLACADQVTDVILTHLHFDHVGGLAFKDPSGAIRARYPNARVHVQAENLAVARAPNVREQASYLAENIEILNSAEVNLLHGDTELLPGLRLHLVQGHTRGQQWVEISDAQESLIFPTDIVPTSHHVPLAWHMGYDMCVETLLREKAALLDLALQKRSRIVFQHDPEIAAGRLVRTQDGKIQLQELIELKS